jgi:zinc protease
VSGRFEKQAMLGLLNRTLGALRPAKEALVSPKVPGPEYLRTPRIYVVDKDVPQSMVQLALPGLRRTDPDWHAVVVMNQILGGGGFTSRLMRKLRSDEGLTYGVGTGFGPGAYWKGDFTCGLQTKNRSVAYAMRLILKDIDRMKREPVTDEELKVIKDAIVLGFPSDWSKRQAVATKFAEEQLAGWPADWWLDYREKIQAVTKEEVQRVARKYLEPSQAVILVVGKASEAETGDEQDHPGLLKDVAKLPLHRLPLRDPLTLEPMK